jgi:hypothetical protein
MCIYVALSVPFSTKQFKIATEIYGPKFACLFSGGVGACGHADYIVHPSQRHHTEPPNFAVIQRSPVLVPAYQERARGRSGVVHVSGEYRPHAQSAGLPTSRR